MKLGRLQQIGLVLVGIIGLTWAGAVSVGAQPYGSGQYGSCQYGSCSLSLSSSGSVTLNVVPTTSTRCTTASDSVQVTTSSSTGYMLQLANIDTATSLQGASRGGSIAAATGTATSPQPLAANQWGYRLDQGAFGAGPTSASSNTPLPSLTYAGVPASNSPATLRAPNGSVSSPDQTLVWYTVCANTNLPADSYSDTVRYTALVNP